MKRAIPADLPADYAMRTEQEKIDVFKNQDFARRFEAWQTEHMRAHAAATDQAAAADQTVFRTIRDPNIPDPGEPSGQDLDF